MLELSPQDGLFVGFKVDGGLRHQIDALEGPDRKYVSAEDSTNLRVVKLDGDTWVGKLLHDPLTTDRVDDVRRNVLSILQRLFPEMRFPAQLTLFACRLPQPEAVVSGAAVGTTPE